MIRTDAGISGQMHLKALCGSSVGLGIAYGVNVIHILPRGRLARERARTVRAQSQVWNDESDLRNSMGGG